MYRVNQQVMEYIDHILKYKFINKRWMKGYQEYNGEGNGKQVGSWEYKEAKNYKNVQSIFEAYPHLKHINHQPNIENQTKANGIVIRSANDDNVHKAIKYGIWTTTPKNRIKIEQLWQRKLTYNTNTYLFFSAVKSGMFEGVALLKSGYHQDTFPFWWENHTLKFKGYFQIQWIYIKDINNKHFDGFRNVEGEDVAKSKDCDIIDCETTSKMLLLFEKKQAKRNIFVDFAYMDERQSNYIRKMYEMNNPYSNAYNNTYQNPYNNYSMQFMNQNYEYQQQPIVGHPFNFMNAIAINPINPMIQVPNSMIKPNNDLKQAANLGFQMNPVSKNKKK